MRFDELRLEAFGPFTAARLDLSARGPALHVLFGHNEAGKTTALRALVALLYGIPERTGDAHTHAPSDLRIGARVVLADGTTLDLVRRKGRRNTLLDADGQPVSADRLSAALGGIPEAVFRTTFGLDHRSLRDGGQALLEGRGAVGESLFDAGVGGAGIHRLLADLEGRAEQLFTPQGKKRRLHQTLREWREALRAVRESELRPESWEDQLAAVDRTRGELEGLLDTRRRLGAEKNRLKRALAVLPLLARRAQALAAREALGRVRRVSEEEVAARQALVESLREAEREAERGRVELVRLNARRQTLEVPRELLEITRPAIDALRDHLGRHRAAAADLPRRRAERRVIEEELRALLRRLGREPVLDDLERMRPEVGLQARLRALALDRAGLEADLRHAAERLAERRALLARSCEALDGLPPAVDLAPLETAAREARRTGDPDVALADAEGRRAVVAARLERALAELSPWQGSIDALRALVLPSAATVRRFDERFEQLRQRLGRVGDRCEAAERAVRETARELEALRLAGEPPVEEDLSRARAERDELWRAIRDGAPPAGAIAARLDAAIRAADALADRLRREADRVARHAALCAAARSADAEAAEAQVALDRATSEQRALENEWRSAWPAAVEMHSPAEMLDWLARRVEALERAAAAEELARELQGLERRAAEGRRRLKAALADAGGPAPEEPTLSALVDRAETELARARAAAARRERLAAVIEAAEAEVVTAEAELAHREGELAGWRARWSEGVQAIGLDPAADPREVEAVLGDLALLFVRFDEAQRLGQRIAAMQADRRAFELEVARLVERFGADLAALEPAAAADALVRRHEEARHAARRLAELEQEISTRQAAVEDAEREAGAARERLAARMRDLEVDDLAGLVRAEERAADARRFEAAVRDAAERAIELGEGHDLATLERETAGLEADAARVRLADVEQELEELEQRVETVRGELMGAQLGVEKLRDRPSAADRAAEAEAVRSRLVEQARSWVHLRLAAVLLRREIERYRERHQGPILARAGELFPRLTRGRYAGLQVGFGKRDEPVLLALRSDGGTVDVDGLSDGTRDQLYLALRLASLERHARAQEPLPLVLDDVLIHFDEDRARAALAVLGELSAVTQVLFFTHQKRLVELAEQAVPAARLVVHDLAAHDRRPPRERAPRKRQNRREITRLERAP